MKIYEKRCSNIAGVFASLLIVTTFSGCPESNQISVDNQKTTTTGAPKAAQTESPSPTETPTGPMGPAGPKGDPGTPAPLSYGAHASAPNDSMYLDETGNLGIGIKTPMSSFHITKGQQVSDTQLSRSVASDKVLTRFRDEQAVQWITHQQSCR